MKKLFFPLLMLIALLGLFASPGQAQWTNGQNALMVIGQPDFTSSAPAFQPRPLQTPKDVAVDLAHGKLYVVDSANHRVLRFTYPVTSNQPAAELVFGQPDFIPMEAVLLRIHLTHLGG